MLKIISILFLLHFFHGCSGVSILNQRQARDFYSSEFLKKIDEIKRVHRSGQINIALKSLEAFNEKNLLPAEIAFKENLVGVIFFSKEEYDQSISSFKRALSFNHSDQSLTAQIHLNLAGSYYKVGFQEKSYESISLVDFKVLNLDEAQKYHKLRHRLAKELGREKDSISSLIHLLSTKEKIINLKGDPYYEILLSNFNRLNDSEKMHLLEEFESTKALVVGYLGYLEAEKLYFFGTRNKSQGIIEWIKDHFSEISEMKLLVENFSFRLEDFTRLDPYSVGILLPLSGKRKNFGKRALLGVDAALRMLKRKNKNIPYKIFLMDSQGSGVIGEHKVRELIEKHYVGVIIGGLFSDEAKKQYIATRKWGAFFISLSQVHLAREKKNHLLLEIPGSVESMVNTLVDLSNSKHFGKKSAIIYPKTKRGETFVDEFWKRASEADINITDILGYKIQNNDYREPVKKLLGLQYARERKEEYDLLENIYSLRKSRSKRRRQILEPKTDFDWVFVPAFPLEAIQIIPSFNYFDAFNVNIIGGPSWRSKRLTKESYKSKNIYYLGDDIAEISSKFINWFHEQYRQQARIIEMMAYNAFQILDIVLKEPKLSNREELDLHIKSLDSFEGLTGTWNQTDGVWLKKMALFHFRRGKRKRVDLEKFSNDSPESH